MHWKSYTLLIASQVLRNRRATAFVFRTKARYLFHSIGIQSTNFDAGNLPSEKQVTTRSYTATPPINMPRGVKKENLPSKICVVCNRPFTWRKKWERVWDEVTTCSKGCNNKRRVANRQKGKKTTDDGSPMMNTSLSPPSMESLEIYERSISTNAAISPIEASLLATSNDSGENIEQMELTPEILAELNGGGSDEALESPYTEPDFIENIDDPVAFAKKQRKALKKAQKAERRAQREGRGDPSTGQKTCDMCGKSVNLLIRCMYEPGQADWKMICGKCWKTASGGVVDGDKNHPHYRYGGLWKNRRAQS